MRRFGFWLALLFVVGVAPACHALATSARAIVQTGLARPLEQGYAVSRDGRFVVSTEFGARLWNARAQLIRVLEQPPSGRLEAVFGRDGRQFFVSGESGTSVYALPVGRLVRRLSGVQTSNDGRYFLRFGDQIRVSDIATGRPISRLARRTYQNFRASVLVFSPDGSLVVEMFRHPNPRDGIAQVFAVQSGRLVATLRDARGGFAATDGVIEPVLWSPDGKLLVTGGEDPDYKGPINAGNVTESAFYHAYAVKVWNPRSGKLLRVFKGYGSDEDGVPLTRFLSPTQVLLNEGNVEPILLDIASGRKRELSTAAAPLSNGPPFVVWNRERARLELRAADLRRVVGIFPAASEGEFSRLAWSPEGTQILVLESGRRALISLDARSGAFVRRLAVEGDNIISFGWQQHGEVRATGGHSAWIWDADGTLLRHFQAPEFDPKHPESYAQGVSVAPDSQFFLTLAPTSPAALNVYGLDGHLINALATGPLYLPAAGEGIDPALVWFGEGASRRVAVTTAQGVQTWSVPEGKAQSPLLAPPDRPDFGRAQPLVAQQLTSDGWLLCSQKYELKPFPGHMTEHSMGVRTLVYNPSTGELARVFDRAFPLQGGAGGAFAGADTETSNAIAAYNFNSGAATIHSPLRATLGAIFALSPDLRRLVKVESGDSTSLQFFDLASGRSLVSVFLFGGASANQLDWLALTPDGFYDGSPGGQSHLLWREGEDVVAAGATERARRQPDIIRAALADKKP